MTETQVRKSVVGFYGYLSRERLDYLALWRKTDDPGMKIYYGEKASTYTSIKLYMEKYFKGLISAEIIQETKINGL